MPDLKKLLPYIPEPIRDAYLSRKYNRQLLIWKQNGCPLPTPHIIKQNTIKEFQKKHLVNTLIETGTYLGDMVYAQRNEFSEIYSIELSDVLFKRCVNRLKKYKHIKLIQGDSGIVLDKLTKQIKHKSIFWLDGHYSGGITAKGQLESPIVHEINSILKSQIEHIILIDDARNFNGTNDYPTIKELKSLLQNEGFSNSIFEIKDDIIRIELHKSK